MAASRSEALAARHATNRDVHDALAHHMADLVKGTVEEQRR